MELAVILTVGRVTSTGLLRAEDDHRNIYYQPVVDKALPHVVPALMKRFSSGEGYVLYDDVIPTLQKLKQMEVRMGVTSNADSRIRKSSEVDQEFKVESLVYRRSPRRLGHPQFPRPMCSE